MNAPLRFVQATDHVPLSAQAAAQLLGAAGFQTDVRSVYVGSEQRFVVAVYVQTGDDRVSWSAQPNPAPCGHHYRCEGRNGAEFTLFSGLDVGDVDGFVARLLYQGDRFQAQPCHRPAAEWDPHRLSEAELASIDRHMEEVERMSQRAPFRTRRRY